MTDEIQDTVIEKNGKLIDTDPNRGIELDRHGDPVRQGSLMDERQSYERVIEGLKMASDAAVHLVKLEPIYADKWRAIASKLDQARRICVQHAGLGLTMKEKQTADVTGDPMPWRRARDRFKDGLVQASGGLRQLATCFRGELKWSRMAQSLEDLEGKFRRVRAREPVAPRLILPN